MLVGNLFNLGFDVNPIVGAQVREAKHLVFQSAAPNLGALPTIHPLAALAPPAPGHLASHDVRSGDTLWAIAAAQYGDPTAYVDIARANGIRNPDLIHPGKHLVLPAIPPPAPAALGPPAPGHLASHDVRPGETLWAIAAAQYGDPTAYADIARANGIRDPNLIHPGQHLVLP